MIGRGAIVDQMQRWPGGAVLQQIGQGELIAAGIQQHILGVVMPAQHQAAPDQGGGRREAGAGIGLELRQHAGRAIEIQGEDRRNLLLQPVVQAVADQRHRVGLAKQQVLKQGLRRSQQFDGAIDIQRCIVLGQQKMWLQLHPTRAARQVRRKAWWKLAQRPGLRNDRGIIDEGDKIHGLADGLRKFLQTIGGSVKNRIDATFWRFRHSALARPKC